VSRRILSAAFRDGVKSHRPPPGTATRRRARGRQCAGVPSVPPSAGQVRRPCSGRKQVVARARWRTQGSQDRPLPLRGVEPAGSPVSAAARAAQGLLRDPGDRSADAVDPGPDARAGASGTSVARDVTTRGPAPASAGAAAALNADWTVRGGAATLAERSALSPFARTGADASAAAAAGNAVFDADAPPPSPRRWCLRRPRHRPPSGEPASRCATSGGDGRHTRP
jgi:hypothetical protein